MHYSILPIIFLLKLFLLWYCTFHIKYFVLTHSIDVASTLSYVRFVFWNVRNVGLKLGATYFHIWRHLSLLPGSAIFCTAVTFGWVGIIIESFNHWKKIREICLTVSESNIDKSVFWIFSWNWLVQDSLIIWTVLYLTYLMYLSLFAIIILNDAEQYRVISNTVIYAFRIPLNNYFWGCNHSQRYYLSVHHYLLWL